MSVRYAFPAGARLRVLTASGRVMVTAEERQDIEVDAGGRQPRVEFEDGGRIVEIRTASSSLNIRCPHLADISVGAISGHVELIGEFASVKVSTVSGHIGVDSAAGDVDVRSVSGHLSVKACGGRCQLNTKSGHITVGRVGGPAHASTISGHLELGTSGRGEVELRTISGKVVVRVPKGRHPRAHLRSLSGRVTCDCPQGSDFDLKATTVSGSIEVTAT